ncbi:MAG: hypothetical protein ABIT01_19580 [Thermoanaerobaculia bacterium]
MTPSLWVSVAIAACSLLLIPLLRSSWKGQLADLRAEFLTLLEKHNEYMHAHPDLAVVTEIKGIVKELDKKLDSVLIALGQLTPRRRHPEDE